MPIYVLRYPIDQRDSVRVMLRRASPFVDWAPWAERPNGRWWEISSTRADLMRQAFRATRERVVAVWDGHRWLRPIDGRWVTFPGPPPPEAREEKKRSGPAS